MAYFPNGAAGAAYEERYCYHCVNWRPLAGSEYEGCPIMDLHGFWNYEAVGANADKTKAKALSHFIPDMDGFPGECAMFLRREDVK